MRRVAITGIGIVSSIGNNIMEVLESLKNGRSGIQYHQEYSDLGFRSQVHGSIDLNLEDQIDRRKKRFMGDGAGYNYVAMEEALADAGLTQEQISDPMYGLVVGSGGASTEHIVGMVDILRARGIRKVGPYMVPRTMSSTNSACLATAFKINGVSYTISSACATSAHCIGNGYELIKHGRQNIVFAGGGESVHWTLTLPFDAMGALSSKHNDTPAKASRPYDVSRDGFVISGGGGIVVLEELEHAKSRGAKFYGEVVGYGATSDGANMVQPSGDGASRCMQEAMKGVPTKIDYINSHGTSTPIGDLRELEAIKEVFPKEIPPISSTKSLTGHALGAAGVHEAIYSLLMMKAGFICKSANIAELDQAAIDMPIVRNRIDNAELNTVMSNSFGFGGTNASLVLQRLDM